MANIYNGLLYNDDVDMAAENNSVSPSSIFETIEDISTYTPIEPPEPTVPEVIDLDPSDTLVRVIDGWVPTISPTGGTPGESYHDTPPTEKQPNPAQRTKTIYAQTQIIISDYTQSYLQKLVDSGARFYVVYTDGTKDEVTVSEIVDPHPSIATTAQIETESIARAINQYFWHDTNGVHVTDVEQDDWFDAVDHNFPSWPTIPYHNILMNSLGLLLRTQLINLASLSRSGITFYDGVGNSSNNVLASFGVNGSLFRADGRDVMRVTPNGVVFVPLSGNEVSVTMITDNISNLTNAVNNNKDETDLALANIQAQIDGVVDTYYEEVDPEYSDELLDSNSANVTDNSGNNIDILVKTPWMYDWTTDLIKSGHEGDLYYNITTGHAWRWLKVDNVWQWYRIADSDVAEALRIARDANTLAGNKKRVFTTTPNPPYDIGDLWVDGSTVKYCDTAKTVGSSYAESDWSVTATDDTLANTALNRTNNLADIVENLSGEFQIVKTNYVNSATYEQNNRTWSANLTTLETTLKGYSDGLVTEEVTNRNSAIVAESNSIKQFVSATYQVKGDYATNTALANEVTARNAAINTSANNILQEVSESYVDNTTLGTYVNQTAQDITTIIGDQNSIKSIIYKHDAIFNEITEEQLESINAYYGGTDPVLEDSNLTDSSSSNITDSSGNTIVTHRYSTNNPAYQWTNNTIRNNHIDDLYINTTNSHIWRYTSQYTWSYIQNTDVLDAIQQSNTAINDARSASQSATTASEVANNAVNLAGNKKRVFTTTPSPPYDVGDLWVDGSTVKYASYARSSGSYNASDWHVTSTDDTNLNAYMTSMATIIRETSSGVLVAKSGASIGTLQGSSNFKVVGINSWSGSTPTVGNTYALFGANGLSVYDNTGTNELTFIGIQNSLPFTRIGLPNKGNIQIGVNSSGDGYIDFYNNSNNVAHLGYGNGTNSSGGTSKQPYYTFGTRNSNNSVGNYSFSSGYSNTASGYISHAEGSLSTASGDNGHAEGYSTTASGKYSHAEGCSSKALGRSSHASGELTTASGDYSHSEGYDTTASGDYSHAEGYYTTASGNYSHAEGVGRATGSYSHAEGSGTASGGRSHAEGSGTASGSYSHAEGYETIASEAYGHASGYYTKAEYAYQFVCGKYNNNRSEDVFEIGYGTSSSRSNVFRVTNSSVAYVGSTQVTSDKRIKTDLGFIDQNDSISFIKSLKPHIYNKFGHKELGFFAQDIEQNEKYGSVLVEKCSNYGYEDFRSLNYNGLIAPIVSALQNALNRIDELENIIENKEK